MLKAIERKLADDNCLMVNLKEKYLIVNNLLRRYQHFLCLIFIKNKPYKYLFTILYKNTSQQER